MSKMLVEVVEQYRAVLVCATVEQMRGIVGDWWTEKTHNAEIKKADKTLAQAEGRRK